MAIKMPKEFLKWWGLYYISRGFAASPADIQKRIKPLLTDLERLERSRLSHADELKRLQATSVEARGRGRQISDLEELLAIYDSRIKDEKASIKKEESRVYQKPPDIKLIWKRLSSLEKVLHIDVEDDWLKVITTKLYLGGKPKPALVLGRMAVMINGRNPYIGNGTEDLRVANLNYHSAGYQHPSVDPWMKTCTGTYHHDLRASDASGDLVTLVGMLIHILEYPDEVDPDADTLEKAEWYEQGGDGYLQREQWIRHRTLRNIGFKFFLKDWKYDDTGDESEEDTER